MVSDVREKLRDIIAEREGTLRLPDGFTRRVRVQIEKPRARRREGDYSCAFQVSGLENASEVREILGYDSVQAIELALRFVGHVINSSVPVGSVWEDAPENMGFPSPPNP